MNKIIYLANVLSEKQFKELFINSKIKPQQQVQKFHSLLIKGLANYSPYIHVLTHINEKNYMSKSDKEKNVEFQLISNNSTYFSLFRKYIKTIEQIVGKDKDFIIICDGLNATQLLVARYLFKKNRIPVVGVLTDHPRYVGGFVHQSKENKIKSFILSKFTKMTLKKFPFNVFITKQLEKEFKSKHSRSCVIEGIIEKTNNYKNESINILKDNVVIYAGILSEVFGIKKLVKSFSYLKDLDCELHLYGDGHLRDFIIEESNKNPKIKYYGVVENSVVIDKVTKARLAINPRPTDNEFTKYSFPSKNIEYMGTGTPLLTTKLHGMPIEYHKYVYLIDDESEFGISSCIRSILENNPSDLEKFGNSAKIFVSDFKNNDVQALKIVSMLDKKID